MSCLKNVKTGKEEGELYQMLMYFRINKAVCAGAWISRQVSGRESKKKNPLLSTKRCGNVVYNKSTYNQ